MWPFITTGTSVLKRLLIAGIGFRRDVSWQAIDRAVQCALATVEHDQLDRVATIARKASAPALLQFCRYRGLQLQTIADARLTRTGLNPGPSAATYHLGLPGVAEPCAMIAAGPGGRLLRPKLSLDGVSVALTCGPGSRDDAARGTP